MSRFTQLLKKTAATVAFGVLAIPAQAATVATFDSMLTLEADLFGLNLILSTDSGSAALDDQGFLAFDSLLIEEVFNLGSNVIDLNVSSIGKIDGSLSGGMTLVGNTGEIELDGSCLGSGIFGSAACDFISGVLLDNPLSLNPGTGLDDPIVLSLTGPTSVTLADGGFATLTLDLSNPQAVPVPAAAWLFGSALFGLAAVRRRN